MIAVKIGVCKTTILTNFISEKHENMKKLQETRDILKNKNKINNTIITQKNKKKRKNKEGMDWTDKLWAVAQSKNTTNFKS